MVREPRPTGPLGARDESGYSIRASYFWIAAIALIMAIFAFIWFSIPGAETQHRLTAPSGDMSLDVGEMCGETSCGQIIVLNFVSPDGERYRNPCKTSLREDHSVFVTVSADWSDDETTVVLTYADAEGEGGTLELDLATDCSA